MSHSNASLIFHIVFSTKKRVPFITPDWQPRLYAYLGGILLHHNGVLLAAGGTANHVHLLSGLHRDMAMSAAVRTLKSNSTSWIHDTFPELAGFRWQIGYGAFSISHTGIKRVEAYLANQEAHHHQETFEEEYLDFLDRHEITYDPLTIWD